MDMSLVTQAVAQQSAQRQEQAQLIMVKAANDMQKAMINMLDEGLENAKAAPAPGTGTIVDKSA